MAVDFDVYMPFNDQDVFEDGWRLMFGSMVRDFICRNTSDGQLEVFADSTGRQVKVPTGCCFIDGEFAVNLAQKTLPVTTNTSGQARMDRVVARLVYSSHKIELDVKVGTPSGSPVPAVTRNVTQYEIPLASMLLGNNYTNITSTAVQLERFLWAPNVVPTYDHTAARALWMPSPRLGSISALLGVDGAIEVYDGTWRGIMSTRPPLFGMTPVADSDTGTNTTWPNGCTVDRTVPDWASTAFITAKLGQIQAQALDTTNVQVDVRLGSEIANGQRIRWGPAGFRNDKDINLMGEIDVTAMRGTTQVLRTFANTLAGSGGTLRATTESSCRLDIEFRN